MNVVLEDDLLEELRRLVPERRRSDFVAEAVEEKLAQIKQEAAIQAAAGAWSNEGRADPTEEVRALRESWSLRRDLVSPEESDG